MQETRVRSPGQEEPLEKEMATHSSIFAWEIPWTEKPGGLQSMGSQRVGHNLATKQQQGITFRERPAASYLQAKPSGIYNYDTWLHSSKWIY